MKLPDKLDVLTIHARLIAETGGSGGLRDEGMLESALAAVENRYRYEQADAVACAATYAYHLTQAHAFIDGNKRVAAAMTETFLATNDFELRLTDAQMVQLFLDIASSQLSRDEVEEMLRGAVVAKLAQLSTTRSTVDRPMPAIAASAELSDVMRPGGMPIASATRFEFDRPEIMHEIDEVDRRARALTLGPRRAASTGRRALPMPPKLSTAWPAAFTLEERRGRCRPPADRVIWTQGSLRLATDLRAV